jgi:acyl carrier protein
LRDNHGVGTIAWKNSGIFAVTERTDAASIDRIAAMVRQCLAKRSIDQAVVLAVGHDDNLTEAGLSSLDIVNLMLAVESEFAIKIPDRDMTPSNFRSIASIEALVRALRVMA